MPKAHIDQNPTEAIRISLVGLRRLFQRKELASMWSAAFGRRSELDYAEMKLLDAVRSATDPKAHGATVGDIADRLGIDPSRASRMAATAVKRGTLLRRASQGDGRKVILEVTARGAELQARGSNLTRARISLALDGWSRADRDEFARLFARFAQGMVAEPRKTDEPIAMSSRASRRRAAEPREE